MDTHEFHRLVMTLAIQYRFSETSGLRSIKRNKKVGGDPHSRHLIGLGRDIVLDDKKDTESFVIDARRLGLVAVVESDHVHLQDRRRK